MGAPPPPPLLPPSASPDQWSFHVPLYMQRCTQKPAQHEMLVKVQPGNMYLTTKSHNFLAVSPLDKFKLLSNLLKIYTSIWRPLPDNLLKQLRGTRRTILITQVRSICMNLLGRVADGSNPWKLCKTLPQTALTLAKLWRSHTAILCHRRSQGPALGMERTLGERLHCNWSRGYNADSSAVSGWLL